MEQWRLILGRDLWLTTFYESRALQMHEEYESRMTQLMTPPLIV